MEIQERPRSTPAIVLKSVGLSLSMALGFAAAFYAGYNSMPYVIAPCIFLEISCSSCFVLINRYLKGKLFQERNLNSVKSSFWLGCVLLVLSIGGCFVFAITDIANIEGFDYEQYGLYAALVPCALAVFWSSVLIYDARYYWRLSLQVVGNTMGPAPYIIYRS